MLGDLLLWTALAFGPPTSATGVQAGPSSDVRLRLTPKEMLRFADAATARGDTATAEAVYQALEQNPDGDIRSEARYREAAQRLREGRNREAAVLLRRVLDDKPDAAPVRLQLARLLQLLGDSGAALRELRAAQATGLPLSVARMVDRYSEALRAARPTGASLEIAFAPDNNVNHATRSNTLGTVVGDFEIEADSRAKSGIGLSLRGQLFKRFGLPASNNSLLIRGSGYADLYGKSRFNDVTADLAIGPELRLGKSKLNIELAATQRWFGQTPYLRSARLGATWTRPLGRMMQVRLTGSASLIDNRVNKLQDGKGYVGQAQWERALTATTGVAVTLGLDRQKLADAAYSTTGWTGGIVGWKDLGRTTFTASANIVRLQADERLALFPNRRSDHYSRFSLGATLRQMTFHGFAPVARLTVERNRSSIEIYDYKRTRGEMAIVRAF